MTQAPPIIGPNKSGLIYRQEDNAGKKALLSHHKGSTAPGYAEAGIIWLDDSATPWLLKTFDGNDWITLGAVHAGDNSFIPYLGTSPLSAQSYSVADGTANDLTATPAPAVQAYTAGLALNIKCGLSNTGAATLALSGLSARHIRLPQGESLYAGALRSGGVYQFVYDGTYFILCNPSAQVQTAVTPIPADADFNTITAAGFYATQGDGYTNTPDIDGDHDGALVVYNRQAASPAAAPDIMQKWMHFSTGEEFMRGSDDMGVTWTNWRSAAATAGACVGFYEHISNTFSRTTHTVVHPPHNYPSFPGIGLLELSFTPKAAGNKLSVHVQACVSTSGSSLVDVYTYLMSSTQTNPIWVKVQQAKGQVYLNYDFYLTLTAIDTNPHQLNLRALSMNGAVCFNGTDYSALNPPYTYSILRVMEFSA